MARKRRGSRSGGAGKTKSHGGLLTGLRGGFQKMASPLTRKPGQIQTPQGPAATFGRLWTGVTVLLLIAALVLFLRRFG